MRRQNNFINWKKDIRTANGATKATLVKVIDNEYGFLVKTGNNTFVYSLDKNGRDAMGKRIIQNNDYNPALSKTPVSKKAELEQRIEVLERAVFGSNEETFSPRVNC